MDRLRDLWYGTYEIHVGDVAIGVSRNYSSSRFSRAISKYLTAGRYTTPICSTGLKLLVEDAQAKYDYAERLGTTPRTKLICAAPVGVALAMCKWGEYSASLPHIPQMITNLVFRHTSLLDNISSRTLLGDRLSVRIPYPTGRGGHWYGLLAVPAALLFAYTMLPRERLSVWRLRKAGVANMEDETEAVDCLVVTEARVMKDSSGADIVTGSRLTKTIASTGKPRRHKYAAKIAQVARCKVGYLKNTPENRLIYQRVMIEIMDKDCVRYCDRDAILPVAIGLCFVYQEGVRDAAELWAQGDSLGVK